MGEDYILELKNITKLYPGVRALDNVNLNLKKGEILGLIGENGAGKSTLMKVVSGAIAPTSGEIIVDGKSFDRMTPQTSVENGIAIIYQEFNNIQELSVAENMFLGRAIRKGWVIDRAAMNKKASEVFDQLGVSINPNTLMKNLTVGYQQMVEIGKALLQDAKILIMDEPSAPLTNNEIENMFRVVELLKSKGVSIIYISHRLEEIFYLSQRIQVLRDGQYVATLDTAKSNVDELIRLMVGRDDPRISDERSELVTDKLSRVPDIRQRKQSISFQLHKVKSWDLEALFRTNRSCRALLGKPIESGQF